MKTDKKKQPTKTRQKNDMENFAESAAQAASDVLGSYTGIPLIEDEDMPVQDADDL